MKSKHRTEPSKPAEPKMKIIKLFEPIFLMILVICQEKISSIKFESRRKIRLFIKTKMHNFGFLNILIIQLILNQKTKPAIFYLLSYIYFHLEVADSWIKSQEPISHGSDNLR